MDKLEPLTRTIEQEDYEWLLENAFEYYLAVSDSVSLGASPDEIYRHMMRQTYDGRQGLAIRCRNAASHIIRMRLGEQGDALRSQFINSMTS